MKKKKSHTNMYQYFSEKRVPPITIPDRPPGWDMIILFITAYTRIHIPPRACIRGVSL